MRMFRFVISGFILLSSVGLYAQHWQGIGGLNFTPFCLYEDTTENVLYVGGLFSIASGDSIVSIARWDGNHFTKLGSGLNIGSWVYSITKYNGEVYAAGNIQYLGSTHVNNIVRWNGSEWDSVGSGVNGVIRKLEVIDSNLYAGGTFDRAGNVQVNSLAKWDGNNWSDVNAFPKFDSTSINTVFCMAIYQGELYIGGNFDNDTISDIVRYSNIDNNWENVGGGMHGGMSGLVDMRIYKNELYISGAFYLLDGNAGNFIQRWDGQTWKDVGGGTTGNLSNPTSNGQITDMKVHGDELYIAGVFMYAGGVPAPHVAKWNGTEWCGLGGNFDNNATIVGWCKDTLYIGGGFWTIDGDTVNRIAKWTGGSYVDTCGVQNFIPEEVALNKMISVYPNPASGIVTIDFPESAGEKCTLQITDISGRQIREEKYISEKIHSLDVSGLKSGIYFIRITGDNYTGQVKFIKQ
jgi:hypothetical protein